MKNLILFIILLNTCFVFGQTIDSLKVSKHTIGGSFSPDYCYRKLVSNSDNSWIKNGIDTLEVSKLGFTTGVNYQYSLSDKIDLATGLLLSNSGEKTKKQYTSKPSAFNYTNHYYYLDIPLMIKYNVLQKKIKFFVFVGVACNVFMVQKVTQITGYTNDDVLVNRYNKSGYKDLNFSLLG